ncbi:MAG TPA: divergent PAP2 family protein [Candidatus Saccharimonadia bacterium]|nr:divergent PAP2 family protein [Candidatus Saccharimonadia bacterium]
MYNPYIVVPLATWAVAQVLKFVLAALQGRIDFRNLYASGGMPSVHSSVVCSLAVTALLLDGPGSHLFGLTAVLAAIIIYDSLGVRRAAGEQGAALNMVLSSLEKGRIKLDRPGLQLREVLGHQPLEVLAGGALGIVLGGFFNYDHLGALGDVLQAAPVGRELWLYAGLFALVLVGGVVSQWLLSARYGKSATMTGLRRRLLAATQTVGWLGVLMVLLQYERASYAAWRLWALVVLAVGVVWAIAIWSGSYRSVPAGLAAEATQARKLKWLNWGRGGKRKPSRAKN